MSVKTTVADQIEGLLKRNDEGMTVRDIAEELEKTEGQIRKELARKSKGRDVRFENKHGKWELATQVPRNLPRNSGSVHMASSPPKGGENLAMLNNNNNLIDENMANEKLKEILGE